jgi:LuxR family transcriptional regulator, regulator of acetate metabolism
MTRTLEAVIADAVRLLGDDAPARADADDRERVEQLIAAIADRLGETAQVERPTARFDAVDGVERAIARLGELTLPSAILKRAPSELCQESGLTRAVLSVVRDGLIVAESAHFSGDPGAAAKAVEQLAADPARLEHPLVEADVVRRRRATIVTDVRLHAGAAAIMRWEGYVAAPLIVRGEAIGLLHADTGPGGRALDALDVDVVWAFARGLAEVYETAWLRQSLRRQGEEMRKFLEWLGARSIELSDASFELIPEAPAPPDPPGRLDVLAATASVDDRAAFEGLLTRRELDVLRLLARGETNGAIAAELVISEATVKFHVVNVLRKLRASNRAEAAARYHRVVLAGRGASS